MFKVCAAFDTETTNIGEGVYTRAFVVCYQVNIFKDVDLASYTIERDDDIRIVRSVDECIAIFEDLIAWGRSRDIVPIVCGYNLMFDLVTLYDWLDNYRIEVNAQSSTNVYTLDLFVEDVQVLRFWDTFHLELNGLATMGRTAGLPKLYGEWDYSLIRTPDTPLTREEIEYARRDVQVIPAYLRYLLESNEWLKPDMLGLKVITKSSLVRQFARRNLYNLKFTKFNGNSFKVGKAFELTCKQEHAKDYKSYATRKAAFRGGLTFTAGAFASIPLQNIISLDVTSMHHLFINGRYMPVHFSWKEPEFLQYLCEKTLQISDDYLLSHYYKPFDFAFHVLVEFTNLRLKKGSAFERWQIGTLATAKFIREGITAESYVENDSAKTAALDVFENGFHDYLKGDNVCAFGKVLSADVCGVFISEVELLVMSHVYDWDSFRVVKGEATLKHKLPSDYVTLQSNILYEQKNAMKVINKNYCENVEYSGEIPSIIPGTIAELVRTGEASNNFIGAYYNSTVKGSFNGIYGTQAQDVMKPGFIWNNSGIAVDRSEILNEKNYGDFIPKKNMVNFAYGLRIVGGSRLHLVLSMDILYKHFKDRIRLIGGDTDSLKISVDEGIEPEEFLEVLKPLHDASDKAISFCMSRVRRWFPDYSSDLKGIGHFDIEPANSENVYYDWGMEAWNKCRILLEHGRNHVTAAGIARPRNALNVENFADRLLAQGVEFAEYAPLLLGYDTFIPPDLSHSLQKHQPQKNDLFVRPVTDYMGNKYQVEGFQAVALYPAGRMIGDLSKLSNLRNLQYLRARGVDVDSHSKQLRWDYLQMKAFIDIMDESGVWSIG